MQQIISDNETDYWRFIFLGNRLLLSVSWRQDVVYRCSYRYVKLGVGLNVRSYQESYHEPQYVVHFQH